MNEIFELRNRVDELQNENSRLTSENDSLNKKLDRKNVYLTSSLSNPQCTSATVSAQALEYEQKISKLNDEIASLTIQLEAAQAVFFTSSLSCNRRAILKRCQWKHAASCYYQKETRTI